MRTPKIPVHLLASASLLRDLYASVIAKLIVSCQLPFRGIEEHEVVQLIADCEYDPSGGSVVDINIGTFWTVSGFRTLVVRLVLVLPHTPSRPPGAHPLQARLTPNRRKLPGNLTLTQ